MRNKVLGKKLQVSNLGLGCMGLPECYRIDPNTPIEESVSGLSELVAEGNLLNIGLSKISAKTIAKVHQAHPLTAVQSKYSLWHRKPEEEIIPLRQSLNIGLWHMDLWIKVFLPRLSICCRNPLPNFLSRECLT